MQGQTIVVDTFCWLHKAAFTCAPDLVEGRPTRKHIDWVMNRIGLLQNSGVNLLLIFDGGSLPAKSVTNSQRATQREENLRRARQLAQSGNDRGATEYYQKAITITAETVRDVIIALRLAQVQYIVAPYEADAQIAYLARSGMVDAVLTEDSDLLVYGCPRVLFKLDNGGFVDEVCMRDLSQCRDLDLADFTPSMFQEMCILAGCDFLPSAKGIGIKKAHKAVKTYRTFPRACKQLRFTGVSFAKGYEAAFQIALWTFCHQRVYCPQRKQIVHLTDLPDGEGLTPHPELR